MSYLQYSGPVPENERERLELLYSTKLLDSDPDGAFDEVTQAVKERLNVATALVGLVDKDRQWFKSKCGLAVSETSRDLSFCTHTILSRLPLVVLNTEQDPLFQHNELVTGAPFIRFYIGVPIIVLNAYAVGTLCAIDGAARDAVTDDEVYYLTAQAEQIARMISSYLPEHYVHRHHH